jgi:hypothetical protein
MNPLKNMSLISKGKINSIWKPTKNKRKPKTSPPPIRKYSTPPGPRAKSNKEKAELLAERLSKVIILEDHQILAKSKAQ